VITILRQQDQSAAQLGDRLSRAQARHELVCVVRSIDHADPVLGHVVGHGPRWVLVAVVVDGSANGWVALRLHDIVGIETADGGRFIRRGLEFQGSWPPQAPVDDVRLSGGTRALVESVAASFCLLTAYQERVDPVMMHVGRPSSFSPDLLKWQGMSPETRWETEVTVLRAAEVTRVDFGGRYESALTHAANLRSLGSTGRQHPFDRFLDQGTPGLVGTTTPTDLLG
jgi:hypothetical protein